MTHTNKRLVDITPIGEIKYIPKNSHVFGYIDYEEGKTFSSSLYPKLSEVLGGNMFLPLSTKKAQDEIPVGTVMYSLSTDPLPQGYAYWEVSEGNLEGTDLLGIFNNIYQRSRLTGDFVSAWREAINKRTFPRVPKNFFFQCLTTGTLDLGDFKDETYNSRMFGDELFSTLPIVKDTVSSTQNSTVDTSPLAYANTLEEEPSEVNADTYILGINAQDYKQVATDKAPKKLNTFRKSATNQGATLGDTTAPPSVYVRAIVKVNSSGSLEKLAGFKPVIRAFHTTDLPDDNVALALKKMVHVYETTHETVETYQAEIEKLKTKISELSADTLPQVIKDAEDKFSKMIKEKFNLDVDKLTPILREFSEQLKEEIQTRVDEEKEILFHKYKDYFDSICCLGTKIQEKASPVAEKLDELAEEIQTAGKKVLTENLKEILQDTKDALQNSIDTNREETDKAIEDTNTALKETEKEIKDLISENVNEINQTIANTKQELLDSLKEASDTLNGRIDKSNEKIQELFSRIEDNDAKDDSQDNEISKLKAKQITLENRIEVLERQVADLLARQPIVEDAPDLVISSEKRAITTKFFGNRDYYMAGPHRWVSIPGTNYVFPAYTKRST